MTDEYFTTEAQLNKGQYQIDFAHTVTFSPVNNNQLHTNNHPSLAMMVVFMLAGFAVGHIIRRGRKLVMREYWRIASSLIARRVMAESIATKRQGL